MAAVSFFSPNNANFSDNNTRAGNDNDDLPGAVASFKSELEFNLPGKAGRGVSITASKL